MNNRRPGPRRRRPPFAVALLCLFVVAGTARAERVEDLASVAGVRSNQLVGYGLVVGLDGTGDQTTQTPFTIQSIENMLAQFGVTVPPNTNPMLQNVAAVTVHASLPPFSKPGQTIDVTVSSIGNAKSLRGGSLIMTPLRGADGQVYAMAQGSILVSGFGVEGKDGSSITVNVPSSGRIPNGATVERAVPNNFDTGAYVTLNLDTPDFTTATRLTDAINRLLGAGTAEALDAVSVRVRAPVDPSQRIAYVSTLERLNIDPATPPARVIINSRTGTVVISSEVHVMAAAVASGSLMVTVTERSNVSQPNAFSNGTTTVTPVSTLNVKQAKGHMFEFPAGVNLEEIVRAVNSVGAAPGDLVAILEALKEAGALRAQLIVI
ncbi:MAG: flagellar basal body P-ring protein FlgI [Steroidobacteraceae bacterium]